MVRLLALLACAAALVLALWVLRSEDRANVAPSLRSDAVAASPPSALVGTALDAGAARSTADASRDVVASAEAAQPDAAAQDRAPAPPEELCTVRVRWWSKLPGAPLDLVLLAAPFPLADPALVRRIDLADESPGELTLELPAGEWTFIARATRRVSLGRRAVLASGAPAEVALELGAAEPFTGVVVDAASGAPIAGALVEHDFSYGVDAVVTDEGGRFTIPAMPAATLGLRARARGYGTEALSVQWDEASRAWLRVSVVRATLGAATFAERWRIQRPKDEDRSLGLVIALPRGRTVRGVVTSPSTEPLDWTLDGMLEVMPGMFTPLRRDFDTADDVRFEPDGRFELTELHPEAAYVLRLSQAGMGTLPVVIEPGPEDLDLGALELAPAGSLRGVLALDYEHAESVQLVAATTRDSSVPLGHWSEPVAALPGAAFEFAGLSEGPYRLIVRGEHGRALGRHEAVLAASEHLDVGVLEPEPR